jgi:hypothetical protein
MKPRTAVLVTASSNLLDWIGVERALLVTTAKQQLVKT